METKNHGKGSSGLTGQGLSYRLGCLREALGLTQREMAVAANLAHSQLGRAERGAAMPELQTILALSSTYRLSLDWLLTGEGPIFRPANGLFVFSNTISRVNYGAWQLLLRQRPEHECWSFVRLRLPSRVWVWLWWSSAWPKGKEFGILYEPPGHDATNTLIDILVHGHVYLGYYTTVPEFLASKLESLAGSPSGFREDSALEPFANLLATNASYDDLFDLLDWPPHQGLVPLLQMAIYTCLMQPPLSPSISESQKRELIETAPDTILELLRKYPGALPDDVAREATLKAKPKGKQ